MYLERLLGRTTPQDTVLLIDGDLYLYRAAAAAEEEIDWGDDVWSLMTDLKEAKKIFQKTLDYICEATDCGSFVVALSDKENFRHTVDSTYKGGRKKTRKPVGYKALVDWVKDTYKSVQVPLLEADDVIGICGSAPDHHVIMVSDDKDLKSVPGKLYRPQSGEFHNISKADADRWFYKQTLMGDVTDGYSGCPGIGEKTAEKILARDPSWTTVVNAYANKQLNANYALTQARLARILRYEDWDEEKQVFRLWEPQECRHT